jgi:hypothetical protein
MIITRISMATGITHTLDLPVTPEQLRAWEGGMFVQDAFPHLTADQREFILTGTTAEEWNEMFDGMED